MTQCAVNACLGLIDTDFQQKLRTNYITSFFLSWWSFIKYLSEFWIPLSLLDLFVFSNSQISIFEHFWFMLLCRAPAVNFYCESLTLIIWADTQTQHCQSETSQRNSLEIFNWFLTRVINGTERRLKTTLKVGNLYLSIVKYIKTKSSIMCLSQN